VATAQSQPERPSLDEIKSGLSEARSTFDQLKVHL
jgi:hypothetical protein